MDDEYGCMVIEDTSDVLGYRHSADLAVSKYDGGEKQHWKWTKEGYLENRYSQKVLSRFKRVFQKKCTLRVCNNNNKPYQKWFLVDLKLRNQSGEYMYMRDGSKMVYLTKDADSCQLKWLFLPIAKMNAYRLYLENPNPLIKAIFFKECLLQHFLCIIGCEFEEFRSTLAKFDVLANQYLTKLTKVTKDVGISKVAGGSTAIVGSILAFIGLGLAPVTVGASLGLTITGAAISTAGGLTSLGGSITSIVYKLLERKKTKDVIEKTVRYTTVLHSFMSELSELIEESSKFSKTPDAVRYKTWIGSVMTTAGCTVGVCRTVDASVDVAKALVELKVIATVGKVDAQATRSATAIAESVAASGIKIPLKGKALLQAGTTGAKVFSGIFSAAVIMFGIYDIYDGAKDIRGKSTDLGNLRSLITGCRDLGHKLTRAYNELANDE